MYKSIVSIFIILVFTSSIFSQISRSLSEEDDVFAKEILMSSSSVRSNGMGMIGVILTDGQSFTNNPATLGFMGNEYFSSSIYLKKSRAYEYSPVRIFPAGSAMSRLDNTIDTPYYNNVNFSINLNKFTNPKNTIINVGIGYSRNNLTYGNRDWLLGTDDTRQNEPDVLYVPGKFDDHINIYSIGMSYKTSIDLGIGISYKNTNFSLNHTKYKSDLFDLGLLLHIPLDKLTSAINKNANNKFESKLILGMSVVNLGNDIKIDTQVLSPPKYSRFGAGLDLALVKDNYRLFSIYPAIQYDYLFYTDNSHTTRLGLEVGLVELLYLRTGRISYQNVQDFIFRDDGSAFEYSREPLTTSSDDENSFTTFGFSLSTKGIKYLLLGKRLENMDERNHGSFLLKNLNLEFSFASYKIPGSYGKNNKYYSLNLIL